MESSSENSPHYASQQQQFKFALKEEDPFRMHNGGGSSNNNHNTKMKPSRQQQQQRPPWTPIPLGQEESTAGAPPHRLELTLLGHGRAPDTRVWIKIADLEAREAEMRQAAKQFRIPAERWEGSLLYRQYHSGRGHESKLTLDPERDCIERNYSYAMQWEDWLTDLLVRYYETGRLNIPDACQGSDLLLLLEYFGILYAPDQLVFASYAAYQRVRAWSDYLTRRAVLADHVVRLSALVPGRGVRVYQLGTVESPSERLTLLPQRGDGTPVYSWGRDVADLPSQSHLQPQSLPGSRVIYSLFNVTKENKVAEALRDDFGVYLQNLLPASADVNFSVKMVQVRTAAGAEPFRGKRAVLKLTVEPHDRTRSEISHPADEVAMNRNVSTATPAPAGGGGKPPLAPSTADHVYRDLGVAEKSEPARPAKSFGREARQRSIDPVMAGTAENFHAPVEEIDPADTGTVTSALTGPFNVAEASLVDEDVRAEALRQEWVQGSLLNRDIDNRMKVLLDGDDPPVKVRRTPSPIAPEQENDKRHPGTPETTPSVASESPNTDTPADDRGCHPWEWFNTVCGGFFDLVPSPSRKVRDDVAEEKEGDKTPVGQNSKPPEEQAPELPSVPPPKQATVVVSPSPANTPDDEKMDKKQEREKQATAAAAAGASPSIKISTHEGVKQRLAQLRQRMDRDGNESPQKPRPQSMKIKAAMATNATDVKEKKASSSKKETIERHPSPSKKSNNFFQRSRQAKPADTKKSSKKTTKSVPPKKKTTAVTPPKKTGLRKLFRRGNE